VLVDSSDGWCGGLGVYAPWLPVQRDTLRCGKVGLGR